MTWTVTTVVVTGVLFVVLERLIPFRKGQSIFRKGFFDDLALYTALQELILSLILSRVIIAVNEHLPHWKTTFVTDWPIYLQVAFFLVTHDFYIYVTHRLRHKWRWWWRLHEAHHSNTEIDW
ncbi:MAG TPA: sterol desaturase family protein, partial [Bacteroidota bacterium]